MYIIITIAVIHLRFAFGRSAEMFVIGWILLGLTNVFLAKNGWVTDIFAIFSKIIIFLGIIHKEFATIPKRLENLLASRKSYPIDAELPQSEGRLILVLSDIRSTRATEIRWIQKQIREALERNMDSYLFLIESLPPLDELRRLVWMSPDRVHILIFSSSADKLRNEFLVFDPDLQAVGASLHELLKISQQKDLRCKIIIDSISTMIQIFGGPQTHRLFLQKMGILRESMASIYGLLHSEMHEDNIAAMFQKLSDSTLTIE
ncbi:MAG: hypothetical protein RMJ07_05645 [Nitrososphaerota archaeon]|nr:hypothetical protein [Candidatus Bathyarchaeota archaeon]MDW8049143.1 hypothetical protein [Nitrososphaerota archaeon]